MSEVALVILDRDREIYGHVHGSDAERAIAALAAEPESIDELDRAMDRFTDRGGAGHFVDFHPGDRDEPWDAGVVVIDLAAQLIAGESSYSAIATEGSVLADSCREPVHFRLSNEWLAVADLGAWRGVAESRRAERTRLPRIDARAVLFGRPLLEYIAGQMLATRDLEASEAIVQVHAAWLMTPRDHLQGRAPREVLLGQHELISFDLQYREFQWTCSGQCPPGLERESAAYRFAPFGTHEIVMYYDLVRFLLEECRGQLEQAGGLNRADEVRRLERLRDAWLECPNPEIGGRTPASVIDNERRRIPEGQTGAEAMVDCDCPICQAMAEDMGPYFWGLDGSHMDDDFAFSFHATVEEWEAERQEWESYTSEFAEREAQCQCDAEANDDDEVWDSLFLDDKILHELPTSEFVPVALFGFAAMIGELNRDIVSISEQDPDAGRAQQETLNRLVGNLRAALAESAELIDPTLDRLAEELATVAERFPELEPKCCDLMRRLREFPEQFAASLQRENLPL